MIINHRNWNLRHVHQWNVHQCSMTLCLTSIISILDIPPWHRSHFSRLIVTSVPRAPSPSLIMMVYSSLMNTISFCTWIIDLVQLLHGKILIVFEFAWCMTEWAWIVLLNTDCNKNNITLTKKNIRWRYDVEVTPSRFSCVIIILSQITRQIVHSQPLQFPLVFIRRIFMLFTIDGVVEFFFTFQQHSHPNESGSPSNSSSLVGINLLTIDWQLQGRYNVTKTDIC